MSNGTTTTTKTVAVNVAVFDDQICVVDNNGAVWRLDGNNRWHKLPDLPQPPTQPAQSQSQSATSAAPASGASTPSSTPAAA